MSKLSRIVDVQVALESTYNTDPGSGFQALLANEFPTSQIAGDTVQRTTVRGTFSPRGRSVTTKTGGEQLETELRPAGLDAGSVAVPEYDALLKCCGWDREDGAWIVLTGVTGTFEIGETVSNDTATGTVGTVADFADNTLWIRDLQNMPADSDSLTGDSSSAAGTVSSADETYVYAPVTKSPSAQDSAYLKVHRDGVLHAAGGVRGTFSGSLQVGQLSTLTWNLTGRYVKPSDGTQPSSLSYSEEQPLEVQAADVAIGDVDLSDLAVGGLDFDAAVTVTPRDDVQAGGGRRSYVITGREPTVTLTVDKAAIADFDPYNDWENQTTRRIGFGLGSAQGSRVRVVATEAALDVPQEQDQDGVTQYQLSALCTGNDSELLIIFG